MKVLVVGSGAREHALAWKIAQSPDCESLFAAPGNAGTARLGENWPDVAATDADEIARLADDNGIALVVVGPEAALAAGVADAVRAKGIAAFGPGRSGARLESSKAFAKSFMQRWHIPTAGFQVADDLNSAEEALLRWPTPGVVVKADGLAAGKGVVVCDTAGEALDVVRDWHARRAVPGGGAKIVLEERLEGLEASVMAVTDGTDIRMLQPARDYKRAGDGDTGPNTGGMGAFSDSSSILDDGAMRAIERAIIRPVVAGLAAEGVEYRGCIYAGLIMTVDGPRVLEFNARFGDPETQVVLPRLDGDLLHLLDDAARGRLNSAAVLRFTARACVGIVLASPDYPAPSAPLRGLPYPNGETDRDVAAFLGASAPDGEGVRSNGGRVLTVTALGDDLPRARQRAYAAVGEYAKRAEPSVLKYRHDIALLSPP